MQPDYLNTRTGPLRFWRGGRGPSLLVLPGLLASAGVVARKIHAACPDWTTTVVELPGIGGSARIEATSIAALASVIDDALRRAGIGIDAVLSLDLAAPIARHILSLRPSLRCLSVDVEAARQWALRDLSPPSLELRADGTHLPALWAHIRDAAMLDPADPSRVSKTGGALPDIDDLDATVIAAAVHPQGYARLWNACLDAIAQADARADAQTDESGRAVEASDAAGMQAVLSRWRSESAKHFDPADNVSTPDAATEIPDGHVRRGYLQIPSGRVHLRRAGSGGRTLLMFHSAPGSAEPLEALMRGLASHREVLACDYLGNGDSDKPTGDIDIAALARHGREIADALGIEKLDLFGTHTGAMIAMEFAIRWPERVGRVILEAPVLIDAAFAQDILVHYLPPLVADRWGTHLLRAWNMRRDMFLFWPWYRATRDAARSLGVPPLATLHDWTIGLLKSGATYHLSYRAAFVYDTRSRLPLLPCPALICAGPADMLVEGLAEAKQIAPMGTQVRATPATVWYPGQSPEDVRETIAMYEAFLQAD